MEQFSTRSNHEIDYKIHGEEMQYVEVELDPQETAVAEAGSNEELPFATETPLTVYFCAEAISIGLTPPIGTLV